MPLKNILHKNAKDDNRPESRDSVGQPASIPQEIRFIRTDTHTQEVINSAGAEEKQHQGPQPPRRKSLFRRSRGSPDVSAHHEGEKGEKRISHLLHLDHHRSHSRSSSPSSVNIPVDLPQIPNNLPDEQDRQAQWENRATILVQGNPRLGGASSPDRPASANNASYLQAEPRARSRSNSGVSEPQADINIQEAIRLHESGELKKSTHIFGVLADPNGANNALAQVLYGLALRHGWGCEPDLPKAVIYLSAAASNSAMIEHEALRAGMKKGGAAKGELVLAIYELANCFRNGWGIEKDPVAARQYYETAANLGDTDAMNECAWCYLEGFGGKKDKFMAAKYYRLAEDNGNKILGNSWIWKDKYNPK